MYQQINTKYIRTTNKNVYATHAAAKHHCLILLINRRYSLLTTRPLHSIQFIRTKQILLCDVILIVSQNCSESECNVFVQQQRRCKRFGSYQLHKGRFLHRPHRERVVRTDQQQPASVYPCAKSAACCCCKCCFVLVYYVMCDYMFNQLLSSLRQMST